MLKYRRLSEEKQEKRKRKEEKSNRTKKGHDESFKERTFKDTLRREGSSELKLQERGLKERERGGGGGREARCSSNNPSEIIKHQAPSV